MTQLPDLAKVTVRFIYEWRLPRSPKWLDMVNTIKVYNQPAYEKVTDVAAFSFCRNSRDSPQHIRNELKLLRDNLVPSLGLSAAGSWRVIIPKRVLSPTVSSAETHSKYIFTATATTHSRLPESSYKRTESSRMPPLRIVPNLSVILAVNCKLSLWCSRKEMT